MQFLVVCLVEVILRNRQEMQKRLVRFWVRGVFPEVLKVA